MHMTAIIAIDRLLPWVASLSAAIATESAAGPVPGWAQGGAVGLVIMLLAYAVRHLFDKLEQARGERIHSLERDVKKQREVIEDLTRQIEDLKNKDDIPL